MKKLLKRFNVELQITGHLIISLMKQQNFSRKQFDQRFMLIVMVG